MKNMTMSVLTLLSVMLLSPNLYARDLVIGLSPFHTEKAGAKDQIKTVIQFLVDTVEPGEQAMIYDAYHVQTIGIFAVPNKSLYRHPRAKLRANARVVKQLLTFAKQAMTPTGVNRPSVSGAIRLPQFLAFLGENFAPQQDMDVLVLGNPLLDDPKDRDFSMAHAQIPGDGHLQLSRSQTPYGIKGYEKRLRHVRLHLGFTDGWQRDDHHTFYVKRFWTLWTQQQGGSLVTFASDLSTVLQRVQSQAAAPQHAYTFKESEAPKLEMIQLRPPKVKHRTSISERPVTTAPVAGDSITALRNVEVGITWNDPASSYIDLDLYVQAGPTAGVLYFSNRETAEGQYFKDFTTSPRSTNGLETVAFYTPVNGNHLFVAINFFGGQVRGKVTGEVRISLDGQTYAQPFAIHAKKGNHGSGREAVLAAKQSASPHWIIIDPLQVLGVQAKG